MSRALVSSCRRHGVEHLLRTDTLARAAYSSDASLYRVPPLAVGLPRSADDVATLVAAAAAEGISVTPRGGGTSCAGNAIGPGLVLDLRGLDRIHGIEATDDGGAIASAECGVVLADLQRAAGPDWVVGPDPSTASRCTIGGMIGNNACGPRALGGGRMADVLADVRILTSDGELSWASERDWSGLLGVVAANLGVIRTEFGRFSRQVSGYSLEHLLPEYRRRFPLPGSDGRGADVAGFWAGTEATLGLATDARILLNRRRAHRRVVVLGYPTMADAADAAVAVLDASPVAVEGLDERIVTEARRRGRSIPPLPRGAGFLMVEIAGDDDSEVADRAAALSQGAGAVDARVTTGDEAAALWRVRAEGAGLAAVALDRPAHAGWEDAAVPVAALGRYLRGFEDLLAHHGLQALPYGHFGEGCVHARIDFDPSHDGAAYRAFIEDAADLAASCGGSMSGEHGDGRARSELLGRMYSPEALAVFGQVKALLDPTNLCNPGVLVDPAPLDTDLRMRPWPPAHPVAQEAHRCTGVGACVSHQDGTMCPSFRATGREEDSTRGRARVLQEMLDGRLGNGGWAAPEVGEALEYCLSCKACHRECPTGVDMARAKSHWLDERWSGRLRPRSHYALGWLPRWLRLVRAIPGAAPTANALLGMTPLRRLVAWLAGIDPRRTIPPVRPAPPLKTRLSRRTRRGREEGSAPADADGGAGRVAIWVDSFSLGLDPGPVAGLAAALRRCGFVVEFVDDSVCCGLTWITTGQLDGARARLRHAVDALAPLADAGVSILGVEPSCLQVWRDDAARLLPDDERVANVRAGVVSVAEFWEQHRLPVPDLHGRTVVVQPHCHERAVSGLAAGRSLWQRTGAQVVEVEGCCGLAGNFGMEAGHGDLSRQVAELELLPTLRAHPDALVIADGFSCRTQIAELAGRRVVATSQLLRRDRP